MSKVYQTEVATRYTIYNSLFLDLPFSDIYRTGTLLPILTSLCQAGFEEGKTPKEIINQFFEDMLSDKSLKERHDLLFQLVQYVERQVVLFDSIEDAAFEKVNDLKGKGTMTALLSRAENDNKKEELIEKLRTFSVRLTLTAHPTQFYPGNVLAIITDLEEAIRGNDLGNINLLLQQLGKTGFIKKDKPSPYDEALSLCWFLEYVFYPSISDILVRVLKQLEFPLHEWDNPNLLMVGFWPGGDRDGNPYVTHGITKKVADKLQNSILKCYNRDIKRVRRRLTFKNVEPYLLLAERRIYQTLYGGDERLNSKEELLEILYEARKGIIEFHDGLFLDLLDGFILKIRIFGFHFASMDIRQDSRKHDELWEELISIKEGQKGVKSFRESDEKEQITKLLSIDSLPEVEALKNQFHVDMIKSIKAIDYIQTKNGAMGCHRYIISNSQSAIHILGVFQLARLLLPKNKAGLMLDIVPLFETIDDLLNAPDILEQLYTNPVYREHLEARGNKQTIMVGFSDGTKDGGYIRANWSIFRAKEEFTRISRAHGVNVVFFDGRGGPPARGGGNMHNFYASLGPNVENQEIQITVQGQTISANYGKQVSCTYNYEQLLSAGLENHLYPTPENSLTSEQKELIEEMAEYSYQYYKELKNHPK